MYVKNHDCGGMYRKQKTKRKRDINKDLKLSHRVRALNIDIIIRHT